MSAANAVLCPADWGGRGVPMVKARLLEVVLAGGLAVAEDSPELAAYFTPDEVPRYRTAEDLAATLRQIAQQPEQARATRERAWQRALREHTWPSRWPQLMAALGEASGPLEPKDGEADPPAPVSAVGSYHIALSSLALDQERSKRTTAALATFDELLRLWPDDATALAGRARCLFDLDRCAEVREPMFQAWVRSPRLVGADTSSLPLAWPPAEGYCGLGRAALLAPQAELLAFGAAAALARGDVEHALAHLAAAAPGDETLALASLLDPTFGPDGTSAFWDELESRRWRARGVLLRRF